MFQEDILDYNANQKELIEYIIKEFGIEVTLPYVEDIAENEKECCFSVLAEQTGTKKTGIDYHSCPTAPYQLLTLNEQNEPILYMDNSQETQHCNLIRPVIKINNHFEVFINAFSIAFDEKHLIISEFPFCYANSNMIDGIMYDYKTDSTDSTYTFYNEEGKLIRCHKYIWRIYGESFFDETIRGTCIIIPVKSKKVVANIIPLYWTVSNEEKKEITSDYGLYSGEGFLLNEKDRKSVV